MGSFVRDSKGTRFTGGLKSDKNIVLGFPPQKPSPPSFSLAAAQLWQQAVMTLSFVAVAGAPDHRYPRRDCCPQLLRRGPHSWFWLPQLQEPEAAHTLLRISHHDVHEGEETFRRMMGPGNFLL